MANNHGGCAELIYTQMRKGKPFRQHECFPYHRALSVEQEERGMRVTSSSFARPIASHQLARPLSNLFALFCRPGQGQDKGLNTGKQL
jgi:hypothetical protein